MSSGRRRLLDARAGQRVPKEFAAETLFRMRRNRRRAMPNSREVKAMPQEANRKPRKAEHERKPSAAGGWGSVEALASILTQEEIPLLGPELLMKQNKPDGYMCVSCSWAKPAEPHVFEFCEYGAKATAWEITNKRTTPEFFSEHTVSELRQWSDHMLEEHGRLTHPLR
jgi:hypothetical protein